MTKLTQYYIRAGKRQTNFCICNVCREPSMYVQYLGPDRKSLYTTSNVKLDRDVFDAQNPIVTFMGKFMFQ